MKVSRAKERALMREFGLDETALTEEEAAKRRQELKTLIKMGKTRGFLTHQEINDHLPEKLVDNENPRGHRLDAQRHGHRGLRAGARRGHAADRRRRHDHRDRGRSRRSRRSGAVDRSTPSSAARPTRCACTCARWAPVELLTREGEIEIAKRIEGGLQAMMFAISASPTTIAEILSYADRIASGDMKISEAVDGFVSEDEADDYVAEEDVDFFDEEDDDDGQGGSKALTKKLEELKVSALAKFENLRINFDKMRKAFEKEGYQSPAYNKAQQAISAELMTIRFTVKTIEKLCGILRSQVDDVRRYERELRKILVDKCGMPQDYFIKHFPPEHPEPEVGREGSGRGQAVQRRARAQPAAGAGAAEEADRPAGQGRRAARRPEADQQAHERGREGLARREEGNDRGQPAPRDLDREEVHQPRPAVPRPDPGRQHRPDEGGRQVRIPPRLQVLDLRDLVDPPGDHALDRRPGAHDPHPGAHDRDDQQDESPLAPALAGVRLRTRRADARREDGDPGRQDPQDHEDREGADLDGDPHRRRRRFASGRLHRDTNNTAPIEARCRPACATWSRTSSTA
jgi:hypothetical protein